MEKSSSTLPQEDRSATVKPIAPQNTEVAPGRPLPNRWIPLVRGGPVLLPGVWSPWLPMQHIMFTVKGKTKQLFTTMEESAVEDTVVHVYSLKLHLNGGLYYAYEGQSFSYAPPQA